MPCFKLGIRFGRPDMVKRFLRSGRTGFYLAVTREGEVAAGDAVASIARQELAISVADIVGLYSADAANQDLLRKASELPSFPRAGGTTFASASGSRMGDGARGRSRSAPVPRIVAGESRLRRADLSASAGPHVRWFD